MQRTVSLCLLRRINYLDRVRRADQLSVDARQKAPEKRDTTLINKIPPSKLSCTSSSHLGPAAALRDGRGAPVQPGPRLLLLAPRLVRVLLKPLREPLAVQVQRRLQRLDAVPVAVVALLQLVGQL